MNPDIVDRILRLPPFSLAYRVIVVRVVRFALS